MQMLIQKGKWKMIGRLRCLKEFIKNILQRKNSGKKGRERPREATWP